jgi:uroporphyrinogen decarboxylase
MQNTTARGLSVDAPLDLAQARNRVPEATLIGNVDPANIVMNGTPATVTAACEAAMIQGGSNGRFILAPGCDVPPTSPPRNIDAMIRAAKQFRL